MTAVAVASAGPYTSALHSRQIKD